MKDLARLVAMCLPPGLRDEFEAIPQVDERLAAIVREASAAAPDIRVSEEAWADHFARHAREGEIASMLAHVRPRDLLVALGCLSGSKEARSRLDAMLRAIVDRATHGIDLGDRSRAELVSDVRTKLLFGHVREASEVGLPRLRSYSGRGGLEAWIGMTITREALTSSRQRALADEAAHGFDVDRVLRDKEDPAFFALRARAVPAVEDAIHRAIESCPDSERALLAMHLVDGLSIAAIAASFGLHRSSVSRRIARTRAQIFKTARDTVMATFAIDEAAFESLLGDVMSSLDVTLASLRRERPPTGSDT